MHFKVLEDLNGEKAVKSVQGKDVEDGSNSSVTANFKQYVQSEGTARRRMATQRAAMAMRMPAQ
jgi:hypothetical protein